MLGPIHIKGQLVMKLDHNVDYGIIRQISSREKISDVFLLRKKISRRAIGNFNVSKKIDKRAMILHLKLLFQREMQKSVVERWVVGNPAHSALEYD